jgi:hypothetical protein
LPTGSDGNEHDGYIDKLYNLIYKTHSFKFKQNSLKYDKFFLKKMFFQSSRFKYAFKVLGFL